MIRCGHAQGGACPCSGGAEPNRTGLMSPKRLWTERATGRDSLRDIKSQHQKETKIPPNFESQLRTLSCGDGAAARRTARPHKRSMKRRAKVPAASGQQRGPVRRSESDGIGTSGFFEQERFSGWQVPGSARAPCHREQW
jgi:hypothetical protein